MDSIINVFFEDFDAILKRMLEHFQELEQKEEFEKLYDKINFFHEEKIEIEDFEKTIKSRTRPLRIGFVGGFSTGKSSIINSLIGEDLLGVKLEPATAQITELSYGEKFEIIEVTQDEDYFYYEDVTVEEYQKSSTNRVNKIKNLSHYIIKHPSKNLSRFTIVDTPGFSSTSKEDDELTKYWIESLDLLIWIFDANKVGDKAEYDKLKELGGRVKVIGVINKIDSKSPGVREKIRNDILNENFLNEVFFYSSKKVLDECVKRKIYDDTLAEINYKIKNCIDNSETFEINNEISEITFKTATSTNPYSLIPIKTDSYTEYHDLLIKKIDDVRNNEINLILNQTLVQKHNDFRNELKNCLLEYKDVFKVYIKDYDKEIRDKNSFLQKSEDLYNALREDFYEKSNASFKVFYTSFFDSLGDYLFYKHVDTGVFSDDVYIVMLDVNDDEIKENLLKFISDEFRDFLESSFNIYENIVNNSVYKTFSKITETRGDEYHLINTIVEGLISSSLDSIVGYHRNFDPYKIESYLEATQFHKTNLDLIIPDELLRNSICEVLMDDLIDSFVDFDISLKNRTEYLDFLKIDTNELLNLMDDFLKKLN